MDKGYGQGDPSLARYVERLFQPEDDVLRDDRHIYLMFDSFSLLTLAPLVREHFAVKNLIVWDKVNLGMGHHFRRRHELVLFAAKETG